MTSTLDGLVKGSVVWDQRARRIASAELRKLRAELDDAKELLDDLECAECAYRTAHDVRGDCSIEAGLAWDHMRHVGKRVSDLLTSHPKAGAK